MRRSGHLVFAVVLLLAGACGEADTATGSEQTASRDPSELAVAVAEATVGGQADGALSVTAYDPGLLEPAAPTDAPITFANTSDRDISMPQWPYVSEVATASQGDGRLGITGTCGMGWQTDGTRVDQDPCSAAEPVADVPAHTTYTLSLRLYPRVEGIRAQPGRYDVSLPLGAGSTLEITYEVIEHDPDELPDWPAADAQLTIGLEEVWLENPYRDEVDLEVVVEDVYDRAFARRDVADIVEAAEGDEPASWTFDIPPGVWRTTVISHTDDGAMTCYSPTMVIEPEAHERTTVIINVDQHGRC